MGGKAHLLTRDCGHRAPAQGHGAQQPPAAYWGWVPGAMSALGALVPGTRGAEEGPTGLRPAGGRSQVRPRDR